jgi:RimJ/RimL family protein N-acetyltransferase
MNGREPFPRLALRPVEPADLPAIALAYRHLSRQSLYQRFFTLMPDPTPLVARHLAQIDHLDHEGFVVLDGDDVIGMAQWDRRAGQPDEAEVAITVVDAWQRQGLGRALVRVLAGDAYRHGIATLTAEVLTENRAAAGLAASQHPTTTGMAGTETRYVFPLAS